jgi:hypothetical protein
VTLLNGSGSICLDLSDRHRRLGDDLTRADIAGASEERVEHGHRHHVESRH